MMDVGLLLIGVGAVLYAVAMFLRRIGPSEVFVVLGAIGSFVCTGLSWFLVSDGWSVQVAVVASVVSVISVFALILLFGRRVGERRALARRYPLVRGGRREGSLVVGDETYPIRVSVEPFSRGRFLDGRVVRLEVPVAPEALALGRPPRFGGAWPTLDGALARVWLGPEVVDRVRRTPGLTIEAGRVELRRGAWSTDARLGAWEAELAAAVADLRRWAAEAPDRFAAALDDVDPTVRRRAWGDLAQVDPDRANLVAPRLLHHGDPFLRAAAAAWVGDLQVAAEILRAGADVEAIVAVADWAAAQGRTELAAPLAARVGVPPEGCWRVVVGALGVVGGRDEAPVLHEVVEGEGYPPPVRLAARAALARIRERIGPDRAGQLSVRAAEGGGLAIAREAGGVTIVAPKKGAD